MRDLSELHRRLHDQGPVQKVAGPEGTPVWLITGYDEVTSLLNDASVVNRRPGSGEGDPGFGLPKALATNLLNMGPEDHRRIRTLAAPAFSRRRGAPLRHMVEGHVRDLLDRIGAAGEAEVDLCDRLAAPLQARVVRDVLGVLDEDAERFESAAVTVSAFNPGDPATRPGMVPATNTVVDCLGRVMAARRARPADDVVSDWFAAEGPDGGLSDDEILSLAFLVFLASQNSVGQNANAVGVLAGEDRACLLETIADDGRWQARLPGLLTDALVGSYAVRRFNLDEITLGGVTIPAGSPLFLSLRAAMSAPAHAGRATLVFGRGIHYCLAADLAMAEFDIMAREVFRRFPRLQLTQEWDTVPMRGTWRTHSPERLMVVLSGRHGR